MNPRQESFAPVVAREVLLLKLKEFLERYYTPVETRTYTAFDRFRWPLWPDAQRA
jgi:hypothetical protein